MAWYSILPPDLIYVESWAARIFVFLGIVTIFPWAALIVFDVLLYIWRMGAFEFPVVGGRARGMQRPRAPTLNVNVSERSEVPRRVLGLGPAVNTVHAGEVREQAEVKRRERVVTVLGIGTLAFAFTYCRKTKTVSPSKHEPPEEGYSPITPLPNFNWETTEPLAFRPFKPKYHLTMALSTISISDLIPMDKTYKERMALRASLLKEYPDVVLGVHDAADPRIRRAVAELYAFIMGTYLPTRYPTMFALSGSSKSVVLENKVTGKTYPVAMEDQPVRKALEVLGQTVDEDFLILLPEKMQDASAGEEERYVLAAYTAYFPSGFDTRTKLGLRLAAIHDPVPGYKEKLERSMDRFFARVEVGKIVARVNWSITTQTGLFAAFGGVHGSVATSAAGEKEIEPGTLDVDSTVLRCERQTLHRLPRSKALVFAFHTYTYPLQTIKEEGLGEELATAIDGLKAGNVPGMHWYKRGSVWGEAVKHFLRS
ncbi:hypothetical protein LV164_008305 [Aspergillus fumigatus]|nr:hypothetical protein KXX42_001474 [Aspergillus fumigatus]KAH1551450.1 hypothetical protein KXX57_008656 [Aspergillus fumigatus]KAH1978524.1 hypothetical protein KXW88_007801 [Aspergillus fumigatus]KAH2319817.1 hypothetical protein KXV47_003959 [Aspergillus fumigatus]KAH2666384.1 hypothetical protein KXV32_006571 [Aspergillus fumigatus]